MEAAMMEPREEREGKDRAAVEVPDMDVERQMVDASSSSLLSKSSEGVAPTQQATALKEGAKTAAAEEEEEEEDDERDVEEDEGEVEEGREKADGEEKESAGQEEEKGGKKDEDDDKGEEEEKEERGGEKRSNKGNEDNDKDTGDAQEADTDDDDEDEDEDDEDDEEEEEEKAREHQLPQSKAQQKENGGEGETDSDDDERDGAKKPKRRKKHKRAKHKRSSTKKAGNKTDEAMDAVEGLFAAAKEYAETYQAAAEKVKELANEVRDKEELMEVEKEIHTKLDDLLTRGCENGQTHVNLVNAELPGISTLFQQKDGCWDQSLKPALGRHSTLTPKPAAKPNRTRRAAAADNDDYDRNEEEEEEAVLEVPSRHSPARKNPSRQKAAVSKRRTSGRAADFAAAEDGDYDYEEGETSNSLAPDDEDLDGEEELEEGDARPARSSRAAEAKKAAAKRATPAGRRAPTSDRASSGRKQQARRASRRATSYAEGDDDEGGDGDEAMALLDDDDDDDDDDQAPAQDPDEQASSSANDKEPLRKSIAAAMKQLKAGAKTSALLRTYKTLRRDLNNEDSEISPMLLSLRVPSIMCRLMAQHAKKARTDADTATLLAPCIRVLAKLATLDGCREKILAVHLETVLAAVMKENMDSAKLLTNACMCLSHLAVDDSAKVTLVEDGLGKLILDSMAAQKRESSLHYMGCIALWNMSFQSAKNKALLRLEGVNKQLLETLKRFRTNPDVVRACLGAIESLATDGENERDLAARDLISELLSLMRMYTSNADVMLYSHGIFINMLTVCDEPMARATRLAQQGLIPLTLQALKAHGKNPELVLNALQCLHFLSTFLEHRDILRTHDAASSVEVVRGLHKKDASIQQQAKSILDALASTDAKPSSSRRRSSTPAAAGATKRASSRSPAKATAAATAAAAASSSSKKATSRASTSSRRRRSRDPPQKGAATGKRRREVEAIKAGHCPANHPLRETKIGFNSGLMCDWCTEPLDRDEVAFSCVTCDFDACLLCFNDEDGDKSARRHGKKRK